LNRQQWVRYVNSHISENSDLPHLTKYRLEKWERYGLLESINGEYLEQNMERTLSLLRLEQQIIANKI
jgi:hypothetical protein